ncbi:uncharacterized protein N7459_001860 [Penicillium hispanicum]|uniref:uncharacterized protein n=1 Tax=Penicillium hispanicum TaxID=1080232 RepID=UPI0025420717|nr:uncharacterized protein N7459_001860 [Penicillium hispanicum]KAJ5591491.1 hypothetical protein N7459_001860 [Penicillium hispanicum]
MWIQEFNRLQELVHAESFRSQYASWWAIHAGTKPGAASIDEDYDFGILILRICLISLQNLPHVKYPTEGILKVDLGGVEQWFYSLAGRLEKSRSAEKKPSLITVQYQFFHVGYLKNYARLRECWSVLTTTIKDVHEMGLHLQHPNLPLTELEMEMRRRTFWNIYVFDRYMCTSFGHWPLIPEGYFDIDVPHDTIQALTTSPYILTPFTDRIFHIKLARWQTAFMSPPAWQDDQRDPLVVAEFAQQFEEVIANQLPAPFWIDNPDKSWDTVEPSIISKRETLYLSIFSTKAALYGAFADPCHSLRGKSRVCSDKGLIFLALSHRRSLMNVTCKVITSIQKTYVLSDNGASYRLFMLPISLIDALASLGVCLLSIQADQRRLEMEGIQISPDAELQCHYATFFDAFNLLCQLAPNYGIVQRGLKLLGGLHGILRASLSEPNISDTFTPPIAVLPATMDPCGFDQVLGAETYPLEQALAALSPPGNADSHECPLFPIPKWVPDYLESTSRSWLFQEKTFGNL